MYDVPYLAQAGSSYSSLTNLPLRLHLQLVPDGEEPHPPLEHGRALPASWAMRDEASCLIMATGSWV